MNHLLIHVAPLTILGRLIRLHDGQGCGVPGSILDEDYINDILLER